MIRNFTPHKINLFSGDGKILMTFESEGLARAEQKSITVDWIEIGDKTVPVKKMTFGEVEGLPETAADDEYFIVSSITAQAAVATKHPLLDRMLVVADPVRDENGQIIGCKAFSSFSPITELDEIVSMANRLNDEYNKYAHDEFGNIDW